MQNLNKWLLVTLLLGALGCARPPREGPAAPAGTAAGPVTPSPPSEAAPAVPPPLEGKHVVMIIAHQGFRDEELQEPRKLLEEQGAKVAVASSSMEPAEGMLGARVLPDVLVEDVRVTDFDAVVFVGGKGATEYWNDRQAHRIAREALQNGKVVAAICLAPVTLANAGVLKGKKATVWESESSKLQAQGAHYTGAAVEIDGPIITGNGPEAAKEFGEAIAAALGKPPAGP
jgi:protease I